MLKTFIILSLKLIHLDVLGTVVLELNQRNNNNVDGGNPYERREGHRGRKARAAKLVPISLGRCLRPTDVAVDK
eukprot:883934-Heterocapsa_arctica.AAC.1